MLCDRGICVGEYFGAVGVAEYQIMRAVPEGLRGELPSIEELEGELVGYDGEDAKMGKIKAGRV